MSLLDFQLLPVKLFGKEICSMFARRVLVVDNDKGMCETIKKSLAIDNYEVVFCGNSAKASKIIVDYEPCIVFLEYKLPDGNGVELIKKIRGIMPELKIIMTTDSGSEEIAVQAMKAGADDYVRKSVVIDDIVELAEYYLDRFRDQYVTRNGKYVYPLDDLVISKYEFLRSGYANPSVSINKLKRCFTFNRQDFYILDRKKRKYGLRGLFDAKTKELEASLGEDSQLSPKRQLPNYSENNFSRKLNFGLESFINQNDPVQIRLEIMRDAATSKKANISEICKKYNLTREVFYQNYRRFQKYGVLGLLDKKKGRPMLGVEKDNRIC